MVWAPVDSLAIEQNTVDGVLYVRETSKGLFDNVTNDFEAISIKLSILR
jgi:hypothetical protein